MTQKMSLERGLIVVMAVCALALAVVGGEALQTDAPAALIGIGLGLVLAVPAGLLLVALLNPKGREVEAGPVAVAGTGGPSASLRSAQDAKAAVAQAVLVRLGRDEGGIPLDIMVGAKGAEHILVVGMPEHLQGLLRFDWPVRIVGPGLGRAELALALGITLDEADGLTGEGLCWLSAKGNVIGFRPEVG